MSIENQRKRGRPSSYKEEYAEQAYKLCLLGYTDAQLGFFFGVSEQTINSWKKQFPDFLESLKKGKDIADAEIAVALFKRAQGFEAKEVHIRKEKGREVKAITKKEVAPDTGAIALWLKNRQPGRWRDNPTPNDDGSEATPVKIEIEVKDARRYEPEP